MSDAKKLRRAVAERLGCDPSELQITDLAPTSIGEFFPTTYVELEDEAGNSVTLVMEDVLGLDTPYVVPGPDGRPRRRTLCGSAELARVQAIYGREAAPAIIGKGEDLTGSIEDYNDEERLRSILGARIRRNAERMLLAEQQNTAEGGKRFKQQHGKSRRSKQAA